MSVIIRRCSVVAAAVLLLLGRPAAQGASPGADADPLSPARRVRAHVEFLASDLLEGREAGTRGFALAARYVTSQLELLGLQPAGDNGSYLQDVPLIESTLTSSALVLGRDGRPDETIETPRDAVVLADPVRDVAEVTAPVVFVGFGVTAPALDYDDYAGVDVRGKIVLFFSNAPEQFASDQRAHFASADLKLRNAAGHGAIGAMTMYMPSQLTRTPWERVAVQLADARMTWIDGANEPGTGDARIRGQVRLSPSAAERIFAGAPVSFADAQTAARAGRSKPFVLSVRATIRAVSAHRRIAGHNVAAVVRGSDPELAKTYVVLSAHLDHIGITRPVEGDSINNGAYDNATGCALLLEAVRAILHGPRPKRSLLLLFVVAEEKGLIGSDYFAHHPTVPAAQIVADVNLDMPVLMWPISDVIAFGAENSTIGGVVARAAEQVGLKVVPDPMPEETIFVRSDQYSFVKQGIPAAYLMPGFESSDPSIDGREIFQTFLRTHYHQPSDDLSLPMNEKSAAEFLRVNEIIIETIANDPVPPSWLPGNFFGVTFGHGQQTR